MVVEVEEVEEVEEVVEVVVVGLVCCNCSPPGELQSAVWPQPLQSGLYYQLYSLTVSARLDIRENIFLNHSSFIVG